MKIYAKVLIFIETQKDNVIKDCFCCTRYNYNVHIVDGSVVFFYVSVYFTMVKSNKKYDLSNFAL